MAERLGNSIIRSPKAGRGQSTPRTARERYSDPSQVFGEDIMRKRAMSIPEAPAAADENPQLEINPAAMVDYAAAAENFGHALGTVGSVMNDIAERQISLKTAEETNDVKTRKAEYELEAKETALGLQRQHRNGEITTDEMAEAYNNSLIELRAKYFEDREWEMVDEEKLNQSLDLFNKKLQLDFTANYVEQARLHQMSINDSKMIEAHKNRARLAGAEGDIKTFNEVMTELHSLTTDKAFLIRHGAAAVGTVEKAMTEATIDFGKGYYQANPNTSLDMLEDENGPLAGLPPEMRSVVAEDLTQVFQQQQAKDHRARDQASARKFGTYRKQIATGDVPTQAEVLADETLTDGHKASILESIQKVWDDRESSNDYYESVQETIEMGGTYKGESWSQKKQTALDESHNRWVEEELSQIDDPVIQQEMIIERYGNLGQMPTGLRRQYAGMIESDDPQKIMQGAAVVSAMNDRAPEMVADSFSDKQLAVATMVERGVDPLRAKEIADHGATMPESERKGLNESADAYIKDNDLYNYYISEHVDGVFSSEPIENPAAREELETLFKHYYPYTQDAEAARTMAINTFRRQWGATKVGGKNKVMKHPPDRADTDSEWMNDYLDYELHKRGIDLSHEDVSIVPVPRTTKMGTETQYKLIDAETSLPVRTSEGKVLITTFTSKDKNNMKREMRETALEQQRQDVIEDREERISELEDKLERTPDTGVGRVTRENIQELIDKYKDDVRENKDLDYAIKKADERERNRIEKMKKKLEFFRRIKEETGATSYDKAIEGLEEDIDSAEGALE